MRRQHIPIPTTTDQDHPRPLLPQPHRQRREDTPSRDRLAPLLFLQRYPLSGNMFRLRGDTDRLIERFLSIKFIPHSNCIQLLSSFYYIYKLFMDFSKPNSYEKLGKLLFLKSRNLHSFKLSTQRTFFRMTVPLTVLYFLTNKSHDY